LEPLEGIELMMARRGAASFSPSLSTGPARLTQALGITVAHDGLGLADAADLETMADVAGDRSRDFSITIEDDGWLSHTPGGILCGPRIGVAYAREDAFKPWRYAIGGSRWISRPNGNDSLRRFV
jgi:DNA-3-methyladenine glycosylase